MTGWWQWHTRTWIEDGALRQEFRVGLGWYLACIAVLATVWFALWLWSKP